MNQVKLKELIKEKRVTIPLYLLKILKKIDLSTSEVLLLLYLYDKDHFVFDPTLIASDLNMEMLDVMESISNLGDKGLVNVLTRKNENGIMEEVFDLTPLFDKLTLNLIKELNSKEEEELNIHNLIENEFNRRLTPLEHEMIDDWNNNGYSNELVKEAVKEASIHGVANLRYIDTILNEWSKKGIKTPSEVTRNNEKKDKVEIINYDWLDEDDEEEI